MARYLEVHTEEDGPVPPHMLLAAQKHGRQVERAGGKGSWSRRDCSWPQEWHLEGSPKGKQKGKGRGPKGKGKNKSQGQGKFEKDNPERGGAKKD